MLVSALACFMCIPLIRKFPQTFRGQEVGVQALEKLGYI